jgi:uncharacterized protein
MTPMKRLCLSWSLLLLLLGLLPAVSAQESTFGSQELMIDLGSGFTTRAIFTTPAAGDEPFPTVILFHGSGPYDLDATYATVPGGEPLSTNFRLIAESLAAEGIAVLRFNKRGVLGDEQYDFEQVQRSYDLDQLVADGLAVVDAAQALDSVGDLYLYGWSEGAWVATNIAAQRDDIAGVILQGAPNGDLSTVIGYQYLENGLPYLAESIDADGDGGLTLAEIATIPAGYPVSLMTSFFLYDQTSTPDAPLLNTFVNADGDDRIDLEAELRPSVELFIRNYPAFVRSVEASYALGDMIAEHNIPTLLLHGERDGWVPLTSAESIAAANPETATLVIYPGLGHALSPVESVVADVFGVMDAQPLADLAAWIIGR